MTLQERLFTLLEHEGLNPNQFYTKSGLGNGYLDKVGEVLRRPTIQKLKATFPHWNLDWIMYEKGDMIVEVPKTKEEHQREVRCITDKSIMHVPLVNQYAYAGYICGYGDQEFIEELPTLPFIVDHEGRGNYIAFEVRGDSMNDGTEDSYLEGDRLLCREIPQDLWANNRLHIRKWDFVIVHEEGILVKRVIDHDVENGLITVHSLNPFYEDKVIDLREVRQMFNVIELQRPRRR